MNNGEDFTNEILQEAERALGYGFRDKTLLKVCFTHKSYSNAKGGKNNERLEFLGDSVLQLAITEMLFKTSEKDEGALTELRQKYVSQTALEQATERAGLKRFLRHSGGSENLGGKTASNLFEAVVGAIYLDGGMKEAKGFLNRYLELSEEVNYKTLLQEFVQEKTKKTPDYAIEEWAGKYKSTVTALGENAEGTGDSKKAAEAKAAEALYKKLTKRCGN